MRKKICGLVLVWMILAGFLFGVQADAPVENLSLRVTVSEFIFTDEEDSPVRALTETGTIKASCKIERTAVGDGSQSYVLALMTYQNGTMLRLATVKGQISSADGVRKISVSAVLPEDITGVTVRAVLLSDFITMTPLAPPANFGSSEAGLNEIKVGNHPVELIPGQYTYSMKLYLKESELPAKIFVSPRDAAARVEITDIMGNEGTAVVKVTSHDQTKTEIYQLALQIVKVTDASLKEIRLDGITYKDFSPDVYEYIVETPLGASHVPQVEYDTVIETAKTELISAETLPGTTVIRVQAENGDCLEYKITFAKTIRLDAEKYFTKVYWSPAYAVTALPNASFPFTPQGTPRAANSDYNCNSARMYIGFDTEKLPDQFTLNSASLNLYAYTASAKGAVLETYVCSDTSWVDGGSGNYAANMYGPEIDLENRLNADVVNIAFNAGGVNNNSSYTLYNINLKPDLLTEKSAMYFGLRVLYTETDDTINIRTHSPSGTFDYNPYLIVSYY